MSSDVAITVANISKCYHVYARPQDRLKQSIYPRLQKFSGNRPKNFYREFWALKDISFEVKKGDAVGILGRNGSGKSTLLQIIAGTLSPTAGHVSTQGRIAALLELGSGFNPDFTGRENAYLNGALLGLTSEEVTERFDAIAGFADIGDFMDQPVKTYSSGMLLRIAFAVQVQLDPDILIIDEALAVGDALFQKRCFQRIEKLISTGTTLLFVSHDQESVRTLTTHAILLDRGRCAKQGVSSEVVLAYRRLLHDEESAYFTNVTREIEKRAQQADKHKTRPSKPSGELKVQDNKHSTMSPRSAALSFGDGEVRVTKVTVTNSEGEPSTVFYPGERLSVTVDCKVETEIEKLNVSVRLRNKEGVKIYSWGTLNQDMRILSNNKAEKSFWSKSFRAGEKISVTFQCDCNLGVNLYEVQAAVSYEETPDYTSQRMLHWVDEAAFFQVLMRRDEHFFGGTVDLKMTADWQNA